MELVFLALPSLQLSILRVAERVAHGGHDVPLTVLQRRFPRSIRLLLDPYAPAVTLEVLGRYIHVYKYSEAVADEVVLDLVCEARELKRYWGTMQAVLGIYDITTQADLASERAIAMLVVFGWNESNC